VGRRPDEGHRRGGAPHQRWRIPISTAVLDRLLAALVLGQVATGLLTLRAGTPSTAGLFVMHGLLGGTLLAAVALKLRRSTPPAWRARRWGRLAFGLLLTLLVAAALVGGFAWVMGGRILAVGPWTVLTLHVWAGLAVVPLVLVHLMPRRWRLIRPPRRAQGDPVISRRTLLGTGLLAALGTVAWAGAGLLEATQGGVRRFTGSRLLPDGGIPPVTTFFGEGTPDVNAAEWRLRVVGRVARELELNVAGLAALGETEIDPVLDCTSGWALRTRWRGVPMRALLAATAPLDSATHLVVRSVTGWSTDLSLDEADGTLLALSVAGVPLPVANGAPARLVVPTRRGLDWVKWVQEIRVS
jgi:hypothetical protein